MKYLLILTCLISCGYDLVTPNGTCYIEMRNSSNGYYGGSLQLTASVDKSSMHRLIEDF